MKITEKNFLSQLRRKNPQAIEYIVSEYGGLIKTVLLANLYDQKERWEECFNDVLLALWYGSDRFDREKEKQFSAWLCAIAKYKAIDLLRREKRWSNLVSYEEGLKSGDMKEPSYETDFAGHLCGGDGAAEEMEKLLACLCPEDRDLFFRRYVKEEPMEQITEETGLSRDVVYARISRGKKRIRSKLNQNGGEY